MSYLPKYKKSDFKKLSWDQYGKELEVLYAKIKTYTEKKKMKIDAVVPILRGGGVAGTYLTYRFNLLKMLPVQYHYFFGKGKMEVRRITGISGRGLPKKPTFLLVEGNHCFGLTGEVAAKELKRQFPGSKVLYAADHMDYSYQKNRYADVIFYGKLTNETKKLSTAECKRLGVSAYCCIFPWESIEEEWETVSGKQFKYKDLDVLSKAKVSASVSGA